MKTLEQISRHLANTVYTHRSRAAIRYWLLGKDIITEDTKIRFKDHDWNNGTCITDGKLFADFVDWYESFVYMSEENARKIESKLEELAHIFSPGTIQIGDFVKISDPDNLRTEYVEAIGKDENNKDIYALSDGTWCYGHNISRYKVQGREREALIDKLSKVE